MRTRSSRKAIVALAVLMGAVVVGVAYAAWTTSGSGTGYAKASTASALTLSDATASTTADLYPGATGTVKIKVTNPNPFPVRITQVSQTSGGSITSDKGAACDASTGVSFSNQTGLALDVPASSSASFTLNGAVTMSNASDNSCQGAVFTIPVSLAGASNG